MNRWYFYFLLCITSIAYAKSDESVYGWSKTMTEVFQTVQKECYFPMKVKPAMIKALDAFTHETDEHSHFLGPEDYKQLLKTTSGNFFGIGVELGPKRDEDDFLMVLSVRPGSPAEKEGILRYDKIIAIDGQPVASLSALDCLNKLKGEKQYSAVTLQILREKKGILSFIVQRDLIPEESCWCYYMPQQKIIYCALSLFSQQTPMQLQMALEKALLKTRYHRHNQQPLKGIILDLRDNAGGVLNAAVECAGLFLQKHSLVVSTKGRHNHTIEQFTTQREPLLTTDIPLIVLVNNYTASCAEILAQALKVYAKNGYLPSRTNRTSFFKKKQSNELYAQKGISPHVFIMGTTTNGKGSVQEVKPVGNQCAVKITTALYYLPDNTSIQDKGITPDFIIKQKYPPSSEMKVVDKLYSTEHKQNKRHTQDKIYKDNHEDSKTQRAKALKKDYQVQCACNLLSLLDIARSSFPQEIATHEKALAWLQEHFAYQPTMAVEEII